MAEYRFAADENVSESMGALLELAGADRISDVQYRPGVGPAGAVELPDDLHAEWTKIKSEHDAEQAAASRPSRRAAANKE